MKESWDKCYSVQDYVYGKQPNEFFAKQIKNILPKSILLPCEGEGRNAVFAASLGCEVNAFDQSKLGKEKALTLAKENGVFINYIVSDIIDFSAPENSVDLVAFIYAHFPVTTRKIIHQKAIHWLKPGGVIILEAFNPHQLKNTSGGPKDVSMLYTKKMLADDFALLNIELLQSTQINLHEGNLHQGTADVIRLIGKKI